MSANVQITKAANNKFNFYDSHNHTQSGHITNINHFHSLPYNSITRPTNGPYQYTTNNSISGNMAYPHPQYNNLLLPSANIVYHHPYGNSLLPSANMAYQTNLTRNCQSNGITGSSNNDNRSFLSRANTSCKSNELHSEIIDLTKSAANPKRGVKRTRKPNIMELNDLNPPVKKQRIQTQTNRKTGRILSESERNKIIDELMPELHQKRDFWIESLKRKRVQVKAAKKYIYSKKDRRLKKNRCKFPKIKLDCHILCERDYDCNGKITKLYCLCGKIFVVTPPKIDPQTKKTIYTNKAAGNLNAHCEAHIRKYFGLLSKKYPGKKKKVDS